MCGLVPYLLLGLYKLSSESRKTDFFKSFLFCLCFFFPVELLNAASDECLWGEVCNPLIKPAELKTSLSIGVECEALIFQGTEHYKVFYIQSPSNFDFSCRENGADGS